MCTELKVLLKELHLSEIKECYKQITEQAVQNNWSYEEYLCELLNLEYEGRVIKRKARLLRESRLPAGKTLKTFNRKRLPVKVNNQLNILLEGSFTTHAENVLAFGNPGAGKSHLICAIGYELINQNKRVLFNECDILTQELLSAKKELKLAWKLKRLSRYDAIIIDDIGYVHQSREEMEVLFTLLAHCYERTSIMLTSNLPFSGWEKIFKDPMTTAAAIDRLIHHSIIIELNIPSYRLENAGKRITDVN
jgi:DNA replication protein DnaC